MPDRHVIAVVSIALLFIAALMAIRWIYWHNREVKRRNTGHTPRSFALIGLGRRKRVFP